MQLKINSFFINQRIQYYSIEKFHQQSTMIKIFNNLIGSNLKSSFIKTLKNSFSQARLYNNIDLDTLQDKWSISICYLSAPLNQFSGKIRPAYGSKVFSIRLVQKALKYVKGRPQYKIDFTSNDAIKMAFWSPIYGKYQLVRSNTYKQQALTIQKIDKITSKQIVTLFKFSFYVCFFVIKNNKIESEKSKEFYLNTTNFNLIQQTIKSGFDAINFISTKQQYQIWALQKALGVKTQKTKKQNKKQKTIEEYIEQKYN